MAEYLLAQSVLHFVFHASCLVLMLFPFYFIAVIRFRAKVVQQKKDTALRS
jgi:hypothetical protein